MGGGKRVGGEGVRTFPWRPPKGGPGFARWNIPNELLGRAVLLSQGWGQAFKE
jgi:hypothetical protein